MSHGSAEKTKLDQARQDLQSKQEASLRALAVATSLQAAWRQEARLAAASDSAVLAAKAAYEQAEKDLHAALGQERAARQASVDVLETWLHASDPAQDVQILAAGTPIALFPVRIETRFKPASDPPELWVRIYPDGILADAHEPWLTLAEWKAGEDYWKACWVENVTSPEGQRKVELSAWRRWLQDFPASRLAWIVEQTTPTNLSERGQPGKSPQFPAPRPNEVRPQGWTRPAQARLLPDRWILVGYRSEREVLRAVSRPVVEPLALTFNPLSGLSSAADLPKDPDVGWAYDFEKAEQAGMAVRVRLAPEDRQGFDRLIVLGVKASMDADQSIRALEQLFAAHRYTRGLALVAQGTPTNNTGAAPAGYPPPDPGGAQSYAVEREAVLPDTRLTDHDGHLFTAALGLPPSAASHLAGADRREQRHASDMNAALWPVTLGYYVEQMLGPEQRKPGASLPTQGLLSDDEINALKEYFVRYVRGRGPYSVFRVGSTPYGLLPVSALDYWTPDVVLPTPASPAPDLLLLQVDQRSDGNRGYLRLGQAVGAAGIHPAGWGAAQNIPGGLGSGTGCYGMCVADVDQDGQPDLLVVQVEDGKAFYRVGWRVDAFGRVGAWSKLLPIGGSFGALTEAVGIAAVDVDQDGVLDLLVFHQERSNSTDPKCQAYYRVGRQLKHNGYVGQWEADQSIPDTPFTEDHPGGNIAIADFNQDGLPDLAVLQFGGEAGSPEISKGFCRIGFGLDPTNLSVQLWGNPIDIPGALNGRSRAGSLSIADLEQSGQLGLVVVWGEVLPGEKTARWFYQVARNLDSDGRPGYPGAPLKLPFDLAETAGVGAALVRVRPSGWINMLRRLRRVWQNASLRAPHVKVGSADPDKADPDKDLLETLSMEASARQVRLRTTLGGDLLLNLYHYRGTGFFGIRDWQEWQSRRKEDQAQLRDALGYPDLDSAPDAELFRLRLGEMVYEASSYGFRFPLVTYDALSEHTPLLEIKVRGAAYSNYIQFIASVSPPELRAGRPVGEPELLFALLRHAMLLEYARAALEYAVRIGQVTNKNLEQREPELVGFFPPRLAAWERLRAPDPSSGQPIWEFLAATGEFGLGEYRDHLRALASLPTAELERLFTETLDVCSHRLDAWITSLATRRLELLRQNQKSSFVGAYGWVEDLRPQPAGSLTWETVQGKQALVQTNSGGHIHAPSLAHAATAAVLRNGYLTRSGSARKQYALDLSSERVRLAGWLLDGLRLGQSLSALLGYRFERGLHELGLETYIAPLRAKFPLVPPSPTTPVPASQPEEAGAARNVVDGLSVQKDEDRFGNFVDGLQDASDRDKLKALRDQLTDLLDAVADLMLAEAVYQAVRGNTAAAVASLDAMAQGLRPPEPEIARSPRSGTNLTHRVAIVLGHPSAGEPAGWPAKKTPRAMAGPRLNTWVGHLLGDPRTVKCRVRVEAPTEDDPDHLQRLQDVTLAELGLQPLDMLALAGSAGLTPAASQLDQRVAYAALSQADAPPGAEVQKVHITYAPNPAWDRDRVRSFPEILELARAIHTVVGGAKPLAPADLLLPENTSLATQAIWRDEATDQRATQTLVALEATKAVLDGAVTALEGSLKAYKEDPSKSLPNPQPLRQALVDATGWGVTGALPSSAKNPVVDATQPEQQQAAARQRTVEQTEALLAQARGVQDELARRLAQTKGILLTDKDDNPLKGAEWARAATARMKAVFGSDFVFLPAFRPVEAVAGELARALASGPQFDGADANQRRNLIRGWFQGAARVRPPLDRWRRMALYARAMGASQAQFDLLQLPYKDGERWVGLKYGAEEERPPSGRLSIAFQHPPQLQAGGFWCGLLLDEWPEIIPNRSEVTGVTFHYDKPGAEAAHAVLLAVSPHTQGNWDLEELIAILNETLDLAHIRTVDAESVGALGQVTPAIFVAENTRGEMLAEVIATNLSFSRFLD